MPNKILVVEDEPKLAQLLTDYLSSSGYDCHHIDNGDEVEAWVKANSPDVILLDIMLPGKDGLSLCRDIRMFSSVPIIMVTARVEEIDRLIGLEMGADDYICKPFSPREVVARVKAILRRQSLLAEPNSSEAQESILTLDPHSMRATHQGRHVELTQVEFQLLSVLYQSPGRIFTREQIMQRIYGDHRIVSDRTIDSHIKKLRRKIEQLIPNTLLIQSVYGAGYRFELPG